MGKHLYLLLLSAVAVVFSHALAVVARLVPRWFEVGYALSREEVDAVMPSPTKAATDFWWVFIVALALVVLAAAAMGRRAPGQLSRVMVGSLAVQGVVFWIAMFCYCYEGFCGPTCLHHGPSFEIIEFLSFENGIFPVALVAIMAPLIASTWPLIKRLEGINWVNPASE